jgi:formate hydrogenlyase subunit 3/multisubunit Na+/H+ antiporter MnhD subunit
MPGQLGAWLALVPLWSWWTLFPWDGTTRLWGKDRLSVGALFLWAVKDWAVLYLWWRLWQQYPALQTASTMAALGIAGLATAVLNGVWAFVQSQPSGVLACAAMSALGIAVQGVTAGTVAAAQGGLVVLAERSLAVLLAGAALAAWPVAAARDTTSSEDTPRWRKPLVLGAFALGIGALAGLPPWGGFTARRLIQPLLPAEQPYLGLAWLSATLGTVLGLARCAWQMWHSEAEPDADPRADVPLWLVAGLLLVVLWVGLRPQDVARWLAELFGELLPTLKAG